MKYSFLWQSTFFITVVSFSLDKYIVRTRHVLFRLFWPWWSYELKWVLFWLPPPRRLCFAYVLWMVGSFVDRITQKVLTDSNPGADPVIGMGSHAVEFHNRNVLSIKKIFYLIKTYFGLFSLVGVITSMSCSYSCAYLDAVFIYFYSMFSTISSVLRWSYSTITLGFDVQNTRIPNCATSVILSKTHRRWLKKLCFEVSLFRRSYVRIAHWMYHTCAVLLYVFFINEQNSSPIVHKTAQNPKGTLGLECGWVSIMTSGVNKTEEGATISVPACCFNLFHVSSVRTLAKSISTLLESQCSKYHPI